MFFHQDKFENYTAECMDELIEILQGAKLSSSRWKFYGLIKTTKFILCGCWGRFNTFVKEPKWSDIFEEESFLLESSDNASNLHIQFNFENVRVHDRDTWKRISS